MANVSPSQTKMRCGTLKYMVPTCLRKMLRQKKAKRKNLQNSTNQVLYGLHSEFLTTMWESLQTSRELALWISMIRTTSCMLQTSRRGQCTWVFGMAQVNSNSTRWFLTKNRSAYASTLYSMHWLRHSA